MIINNTLCTCISAFSRPRVAGSQTIEEIQKEWARYFIRVRRNL